MRRDGARELTEGSLGRLVSLAEHVAKTRSRRDRADMTRVIQELAHARGLDDPRTRRALDVVRVGLEYLAGEDRREEAVDRMHAAWRGGKGTTADLRDAAKRLASVARNGVVRDEAMHLRLSALLDWILVGDVGDADGVDLDWLAQRLDELRAGLAATAAGKRSQLGVGTVLAEITWRAGSHGAADYDGNGETDAPSAKWLDKVRKDLARG